MVLSHRRRRCCHCSLLVAMVTPLVTPLKQLAIYKFCFCISDNILVFFEYIERLLSFNLLLRVVQRNAITDLADDHRLL